MKKYNGKKYSQQNKIRYNKLQPLLQLNFTNTRSFQNIANDLNGMSMITKIDQVKTVS